MSIVIGSAGPREIILDLGTELDEATITITLLTVEFNIFETTEFSPVIGIKSEIDQTGWLMDKALLVDEEAKSTTYSTYTGGNTFLLKDGTISSDWTSGTVSDIEVVDIGKTYFPRIKTGDYSTYSDIKHLFSDYSYTSLITSDEDGLWTIELDADYITDSIQLATFRRNSNLLNTIIDSYTNVDTFTEDSYNKEYIVSGTTLSLNKSPYTQHGVEFGIATYPVILANNILLGSGNGSSKDFFSTLR